MIPPRLIQRIQPIVLKASVVGTRLPAAMRGSIVDRFGETALVTERLFEAMSYAWVRRLVRCSSFSVFDWLAVHGTVDEELRVARHGCDKSASMACFEVREQCARLILGILSRGGSVVDMPPKRRSAKIQSLLSRSCC